MWRWDQGHLPYFQFDDIRKMAALVVTRDFRSASRAELLAATGLGFTAPSSHTPWRQYSRALRLTFLISKVGEQAAPTALAKALAIPGAVTCDEYLHFIVSSFTDPSPAFVGWSPHASFRYPLLFSLKYLLAKCAIGEVSPTPLDEVINAYKVSHFSGDEDQDAYLQLLGQATDATLPDTSSWRQARESLRVISQISYLHIDDAGMALSLDKDDASEIFNSLAPVTGKPAQDRDAEVRRLADLFQDGSTQDFFGYANTIVTEVVESGFVEGSKVKRTHVTIERNRELRKAFFAKHLSPVCDMCLLHTVKTYPWTSGVLDVHHLLPLSSGTRVIQHGMSTVTTLDDLVPVCPSCHRAVHRFYDRWLRDKSQLDFRDKSEARGVYSLVKSSFGGAVYVQS